MSARLGILGGTFNPVHVGHLRLALEMAFALDLDRVELVPAARPPHKTGDGLLPFNLRARLLDLAVEGLDQLGVNRMEARRPGPSYTVDTLEELALARPDEELWFILGSGDLLNLHGWRQGDRVGRLANLAVAGRENLGSEAVEAYLQAHPELGFRPAGQGFWDGPAGRRLALVEVPRLDISASFIRERFRQEANLRFLLPPGVEEELARLRPSVLGVWR